jgi:hypothetical protein
VEVITHARRKQVLGHYERVAHWRVRLANYEAANSALMSVLVIGLVALALVRSCIVHAMPAGQIFTVLGYVMMFAMGLINTPALVQQLSRLRDITQRLQQKSLARA